MPCIHEKRIIVAGKCTWALTYPNPPSCRCPPRPAACRPEQGGAIALSGGNDWFEKKGATAILRNSTFEECEADGDSAGVIYGNEFTYTHISGDENKFIANKCRAYGGVLAATANTTVVVEGGDFIGNFAGEVRVGTIGGRDRVEGSIM